MVLKLADDGTRVELFLSIVNNILKNSFAHRPLLAVLACTGVMIYLSGMIPYTSLPFSHWDLRNYRQMAQASPHIDRSVCLPGSGIAYYGWAFLKYLVHFVQPDTLFRRLVNAFVPFSFLPIIFLRETKDLLVKYKHMGAFYLLVFISTVFGGDAERLMAPAFIVFYVLLGFIIERTIVGRPFQSIGIIGIAFMSTIHHQNARFLLPSQKYTVLVSMGSLLLMTVLCIFYRRERKLS